MSLIKIGVISDTHGELSPQARSALQGLPLIIHAGDLDRPEILAELAQIAPVRAVRGNMDRGAWSQTLPASDVVQAGGASLYVLHNLLDLDLNPQAAGFQAVIYGHTHRPETIQRGGVLFLNPGSASSPRGIPHPSLAVLAIDGPSLSAEIIQLKP